MGEEVAGVAWLDGLVVMVHVAGMRFHVLTSLRTLSLDGETGEKRIGTAGRRDVGRSALLHRGSSHESREGRRNKDRLHDEPHVVSPKEDPNCSYETNKQSSRHCFKTQPSLPLYISTPRRIHTNSTQWTAPHHHTNNTQDNNHAHFPHPSLRTTIYHESHPPSLATQTPKTAGPSPPPSGSTLTAHHLPRRTHLLAKSRVPETTSFPSDARGRPICRSDRGKVKARKITGRVVVMGGEGVVAVWVRGGM